MIQNMIPLETFGQLKIHKHFSKFHAVLDAGFKKKALKIYVLHEIHRSKQREKQESKFQNALLIFEAEKIM